MKLFEIQAGDSEKSLIENKLGSVLMSSNGKNINLTEVSRVKHGGVFERGKGDVVKAKDILDDDGKLKGNVSVFFSDKVGNEGIYLNINGKTYKAGDNIIGETALNTVREATSKYNMYGKVIKDAEKAAQGDKKALERCREFAKNIDELKNSNISTYDDATMLSLVWELSKKSASLNYSIMYDTYTEALFGKSAGRRYEVGKTQTVNNEEDEED
jgi:hypothetical protein